MAKAKEFLNVINAPLLSYPDDTKLSEIYDIPGLHCMTGIVAKLISEVEKSFDCCEEKCEGKTFVHLFLTKNNIHRTEYQGSHSFEGNHARELLKVIARMRLDVENLSEEEFSLEFVNKPRIMKIIDTIQAFDWVVASCFSKELIGDYVTAIHDFSELYMELHNNYRVSVTVKAHLVMKHVIPQINKKHPGFGIGVLTEQSFESAHHEFKLEWQKTKLTMDHPNYPQALLDCVVR